MRKAIIKARTSDDILHIHSEIELVITSRVVKADLLNNGTYNPNNLVSKTIEELADWTQAGHNQIYDPFLDKYRDSWTTEEIMDILEF